MSLRYGFLAVEGPHDRAFVGRILRALGFGSFKDKKDEQPKGPWDEGRDRWLDDTRPHEALGGHTPAECFGFWKPWLPSFPKRSQKIGKAASLYHPIDGFPEIWTRTQGDLTWSIGVHAAGGSEIGDTLARRVTSEIDAPISAWRAALRASEGMLGILVDSDDGVEDAWKKLNTAWSPRLTPWPGNHGEVVGEAFRVGVFVLPDGARDGTVEDVLWPLGRERIGPLAQRSEDFVAECEPQMRARFPRSVGAPWSGKVGKARVAAVASILQPGFANAITIEKDEWLTADDLAGPHLAPVVGFLRALMSEKVSRAVPDNST